MSNNTTNIKVQLCTNLKGDNLNKKIFIILLFLFIAINLSAQEITRDGKIENDIVFTTYDGETHSLFALLESGKHVYCTSFKYPG